MEVKLRVEDSTRAWMWESKCRREDACQTCECVVSSSESYEDCREKYEDLFLTRDLNNKLNDLSR